MKQVFNRGKTLQIELKVALLKRDLQQRELASLLKTTPARVSRIVRGRVQPRPLERARISRLLKTPTWRLFPKIGRGRLLGRRAKSSKEI